MTGGFTKLFTSITHSTVWMEPDNVRLVWITMLAMADQHGRVHASVPGLAHTARVELQRTREALDVLAAPDPDSRTPDHEGRRIEPIDGGWVLLNHAKYREARNADERRAYKADKQRGYRARDAAEEVSTVDKRGQSGPRRTQAEADTEAEAVSQKPEPGARSDAAPTPAKAGKAEKLKRGTRLPTDWEPKAPDLEIARELGVDLRRELPSFRDYWAAKAGKDATKLDWDGTFRNWLRRATPTLQPGGAKPAVVGGAKAALKRTESVLENQLGYAKQRYDRGEFGEGPEGLKLYQAEVKSLTGRYRGQ